MSRKSDIGFAMTTCTNNKEEDGKTWTSTKVWPRPDEEESEYEND